MQNPDQKESKAQDCHDTLSGLLVELWPKHKPVKPTAMTGNPPSKPTGVTGNGYRKYTYGIQDECKHPPPRPFGIALLTL